MREREGEKEKRKKNGPVARERERERERAENTLRREDDRVFSRCAARLGVELVVAEVERSVDWFEGLEVDVDLSNSAKIQQKFRKTSVGFWKWGETSVGGDLWWCATPRCESVPLWIVQIGLETGNEL